MDPKDDLSRLKLRRHFYITSEPGNLQGLFQKVDILPGFYLYYHIDLSLSSAQKSNKKLFLLGNIFDPVNTRASNQDIVNTMVNFSFDDLLKKCDIYAGRYVIIHKDGDNLRLFHDFMSHFKVYW